MSNLETYNKVFCDCLNLGEAALAGLKYQDVTAWDSLGHMEIMAGLEDAFGIELDIDDIIDFSSYEKGKEILKKYSVEV